MIFQYFIYGQQVDKETFDAILMALIECSKKGQLYPIVSQCIEKSCLYRTLVLYKKPKQ